MSVSWLTSGASRYRSSPTQVEPWLASSQLPRPVSPPWSPTKKGGSSNAGIPCFTTRPIPHRRSTPYSTP